MKGKNKNRKNIFFDTLLQNARGGFSGAKNLRRRRMKKLFVWWSKLAFVTLLIFAWIFSGWPQIPFAKLPPKIEKAQASTITYVGGQAGSSAGLVGNTTVNFSLTGGSDSTPQAGDLVVISFSNADTGNKALTITNASAEAYNYAGGSDLYQNGFLYDSNFVVGYRFMPATPETSALLAGGDGSGGRAWTVHVFRDVDPATPLDVAVVTAGNTGTHLADPGQILPTTSGAWIYVAGAGAVAAGADFAAAYLTDFRTANGADTQDGTVGAGYATWTSGTYEPAAFTGGGTDSSDDSWNAVTLALRPDAWSLEQEGFAFGDDDGSETAHTLNTQDTNLTAGLGAQTLRTILNATGDPLGREYQLKYQKNGSGGYDDVPTTSSSEGFRYGLSDFLTEWPGIHTAFSFNNTNANTGTDVTHDANSSSYAQADTNIYLNYGLNASSLPDADGDFDIYTVTDAAMLLYIPTDLATGVYGLWWNGGTTNAQGGFIRSQENGTTIDIGISHNAGSSNLDYTSYTITERGWVSVGFQFEDNSGNIALWVNGLNVSEVARTYGLAYGSGNPGIGDNNGVDYPSWGAESTINGTGLIIANFVADNPNSTNTAPPGCGDEFYTDYFETHNNNIINEIYISASDNVTLGGEATTARLTAPSGKSGNFTTGRRWDDENGSDSINIAENEYTELEWVLTTQAPATTDDYFEFRVYKGDVPIDTYTLTPKWTIEESVRISVSIESDKEIAYGEVPLNSERDTTASGTNDTQIASNDGSVAETFSIATSNAIGAVSDWTVATAAGSDFYVHSFSTSGGSSWEILNEAGAYETLATNVATGVENAVDFDLKIGTPSYTTDYDQKTITVTIQAVEYSP